MNAALKNANEFLSSINANVVAMDSCTKNLATPPKLEGLDSDSQETLQMEATSVTNAAGEISNNSYTERDQSIKSLAQLMRRVLHPQIRNHQNPIMQKNH